MSLTSYRAAPSRDSILVLSPIGYLRTYVCPIAYWLLEDLMFGLLLSLVEPFVVFTVRFRDDWSFSDLVSEGYFIV